MVIRRGVLASVNGGGGIVGYEFTGRVNFEPVTREAFDPATYEVLLRYAAAAIEEGTLSPAGWWGVPDDAPPGQAAMTEPMPGLVGRSWAELRGMEEWSGLMDAE